MICWWAVAQCLLSMQWLMLCSELHTEGEAKCDVTSTSHEHWPNCAQGAAPARPAALVWFFTECSAFTALTASSPWGRVGFAACPEQGRVGTAVSEP